MSATKTVFGIVLAAWCASWLATGCVRLDEPTFICSSNADCNDDEKCVASGCHAKTFCASHYDCAADQRCSDSRCLPNECTEQDAGTACHGFGCNTFERACKTRCSRQEDCATGFHCALSQCLAGPPTANGAACSSSFECASQTCCPKGSGSVCATTCALSGNVCTSSIDCVSGNCCEHGSGAATCSASVCPECSTDSQCEFGKVCLSEKCVVPPPKLKQPGDTCGLGTECSSGVCDDGQCRGTAGKGQMCQQNYNCASGRPCCKARTDKTVLTCGDLDMGCPGGIGAGCQGQSDCVEGNCTNFCTKKCAADAECGLSPWGVANVCVITDGSGQCFPGCVNGSQCTQNVGPGLVCGSLGGNGKMCYRDL